MNKDNTSGFCSQGHLRSEQVELVRQEAEASRELGRRFMGQRLSSRLEEEVDVELGPRGRPAGGVSGIWRCRRCETQLRGQFRRNGHYQRQVVTSAGVVVVRVPLVRCRCGGYVITPWKALAPRVRTWYDIRQGSVQQYLSGPSYRKTAELLSQVTGTEISHMAGWREMQVAGAAARATKKQLSCPEVVILDEMYVWEKGSKKAGLLAIDPQGTVLDFEGPTARSAESWRRLLERLSERGVDPEHGLKYVVADGDTSIRQAVDWVWGKVEVQHCVWHILMSIRAEARRVFGETSRSVKEVVDEARAVLMHKERTAEARERAALRLAAFVKKHAGRPWGDILARCYTQATTYLMSSSLPCTNGTAERAIKELRRRIKTMDGFKSHMGAKNCLAVLIQWYNWWRENHSRSMLTRCTA